MPLSRDDLKALRSADDSVSFYWLHEFPTDKPRSIVVARKRHNPGDGFNERTLNRTIVLNDPVFTIYERNGDSGRSRPLSCFWSVMTPKFHAEWRTVVDLLREGDELIPEWVGGNSNENIRKAGLTKDEFKLRVRRRSGKGDKVMTFFMDDCVTPIGCSAAMIQL